MPNCLYTHTVVREQLEVPNKYFFHLLQSRRQQAIASSLYTSDGDLVTDRDSMLATVKDLYSTLYSCEQDLSVDSQDEFLNQITTSLSDTQRESLHQIFTLDELRRVLFDCPKEKTAGYDGLPYEFYQTFWDVLGPDFLRLLQIALTEEQGLPYSHTRSVLTLLCKRGDRRFLQNWRPLSLLCCDYKIITKLLANRLTTVLATLLSPRQTAGVPGRKIAYHLQLIRDFIFFADANKIHG